MFESLLREKEILYIAIDESRRPIHEGKKIKNFDFIVSSFNGKYLVDIKGKKFAGKRWANWVHETDLTGLKSWGNHFNAFVPLLVIPYWVENNADKKLVKDFSDIRNFKGKTYGLIAITLADFYSKAKRIAKKWDAIGIGSSELKEICHPISYFIPELKKNW